MKRALDLESEDLCEVPTLTRTSHANVGSFNSPKLPSAREQDQQIGLYGLLCLRMLKEEEESLMFMLTKLEPLIQ